MIQPHADGKIDFVSFQGIDGQRRRQVKNVIPDARRSTSLGDELRQQHASQNVRHADREGALGSGGIEPAVTFQHTFDLAQKLAERVNELQDGQVVGHEGAWLTEANGSPPGIFMPAAPTVGHTFNQEQVPGVAEAQSKVVAVDQTVTSASGTFTGCIQTEDSELLEEVVEQKYYCPGVGLVREEFPGGHIDLLEFEMIPAQ